MQDYFPTFESLEYLRKQFDPFERQMQAAWDYINSDRDTMGQFIHLAKMSMPWTKTGLDKYKSCDIITVQN